mgnify:CR=1 FL=1|tara:strand:- start:6 stop:539 length:534 start_codon:yes stop_codon:yes gene_type:complete
MAKGGQKDHSGMNKETYDRHYAANKYQGGHHGVEGSPNKQIGTVDPLTGLPVQQMTNVPPAPSNTLGQAQPVFNKSVQQAAQGIYGSVDQRQNAVEATPLFQDKNQLGNTQEQQAKLNSAENSKQVKFAKEFNDYTAAVKDKTNWEDTENDFGFGSKEYPEQRNLDSLKTVYKNKKL